MSRFVIKRVIAKLLFIRRVPKKMDKMKKLKKTVLTQTTEEYAGRSSIHGIAYIFDKELNMADRLLWLFFVLAFAGVAAALTWNFWSQWKNEQVRM